MRKYLDEKGMRWVVFDLEEEVEEILGKTKGEGKFIERGKEKKIRCLKKEKKKKEIKVCKK